jgi:hypothetical protein
MVPKRKKSVCACSNKKGQDQSESNMCSNNAMSVSPSSKPMPKEKDAAAKLWSKSETAFAAKYHSPHLENVDNVLAQELNQLSFQERNKIQEEMHAVVSFAVEETPALIEKSLRQMERALEDIPSKKAFDTAIAMNSSYAQDRDLWLTYLRADLFDPSAAALRMTKHLDLLHHFYGVQALHRPLQYSDLTEEEKAFMKTGAYQILPSRDRGSRMILFLHSNHVGSNHIRVSSLHLAQ